MNAQMGDRVVCPPSIKSLLARPSASPDWVYPNFPEDGYRVRVARVDHRCSLWFDFCDGDGVIHAGEKYGVGESDPDVAGGFGRRMYCCSCMALAAVAL